MHTAVATKLGRYRQDLEDLQEVRWEKVDTEQSEVYTFFYGKGNEKSSIRNRITCAPENSISS